MSLNRLHVFSSKKGLLFSEKREHEVAPGRYLGFTNDVFLWPKKLNTGRVLFLDEDTGSFFERFNINKPAHTKKAVKAVAVRVASVPSGVVTATCCYCEKRIFGTDVTREHLVPKSSGGTSNKKNILPCCAQCNGERENWRLRNVLSAIALNKHRFCNRTPEELVTIKRNIERLIEYTEKNITSLHRDGMYKP